MGTPATRPPAPAEVMPRLEFRYPWSPGLISVVWPSRQREAMALEGLATLRSLAAVPCAVEYGVAYDADDPATGEWAHREGLFTWQASRRLGWAGHAEYSGRLWERARGEWVLCWGDDGRMLTEGWDDQLRQQPPGVAWLGGHPRDHNTFPAAHRLALQAIGEFLPSPHIDTWLTDVAQAAGCLRPTNIRITEDRYDLTGNNLDQVWREGSVNAYQGDQYASLAPERARHAARLAAAL
jgi:hypothetical protein